MKKPAMARAGHGWTSRRWRPVRQRAFARRLIVFAVVLTTIAASPLAGAAEPPNLIDNGGFEDGDALPSWWSRFPAKHVGENRHARDTQTFRSGAASALLVSATPKPSGQPPIQWSRYGIAIADGAVFRVTFYVKTDGVAAAGAGCHFYDAARNHLGFTAIPGPPQAATWQRVTRSVPVPSGAHTMGFVLYGNELGKTWYDDVSVVHDLEAAARREAVRRQFDIARDGDAPFRVVAAHSLQKIPRTEPVLDGPIVEHIELTAAGDESESFQLVVIAHDGPLPKVTVKPTPLHGPAGTLPVDWRRVGYVKTAPPSYPVPYVGWWPDPLLPPAPFDVPAGQRQPLWFRVDVPPEATAGVYTGQVSVRCGDHTVSTPIALRVRPFRLPRPGRLATPFGLYATALAKGYDRSAPYRTTMSPQVYLRWCRFLADRRLTPKNVAREYIDVQRDATGWRVDLSPLQQTAGPLAASHFAPHSFCLHRLPVAATLRREGPLPDPAAWVETAMAIATRWKQRGLPQEVFIYGPDEPRPEDYPFLRGLYGQLRRALPEYPIMQTIGDARPEALAGLVDIWCPLTSRVESEFYRQRRQAGDTLWTYVCCGPKPPHANFFIDQPAVDHRVLFWQTRKVGATGLLYWCVCWWPGLPTPAAGEACFPEVPVDMANVKTYQSFKCNGDGLLLYPGPDWTPYSSVRLEIIRDGIEDYEYLALLSELVAQAEGLAAGRIDQATLDEAKRLAQVPDEVSRTMTDFTKEAATLLDHRRRVADAIERLTGALPAGQAAHD